MRVPRKRAQRVAIRESLRTAAVVRSAQQSGLNASHLGLRQVADPDLPPPCRLRSLREADGFWAALRGLLRTPNRPA